MTKLSKENLKDFQNLYLKHFDIKLSESENLDKCLSLINLTKTVLFFNNDKNV